MKNIKEFDKDFILNYQNRILNIGVFEKKTKRYKVDEKTGIPNKKSKTIAKENNANILKEFEIKYQILSNPVKTQQTENTKRYLNNYFTKQNLTQNEINQIQNGIKSTIISPILNKKTGRSNSYMTIERKGFDWWGVNSRQLINSIEVKTDAKKSK